MDEQQKKEMIRMIRDELKNFIGFYKYNFQHNIDIFDNINIATGKINGTKIGTEISQKIGFHGTTPVIQASHIADPIGGSTVDAQARGVINAILIVLENKGFIAKS